MLKIEMLGPLQVQLGAKTAVFRTDAERVLLAYLASHQGRPQRRDTLSGLLSPDRPDKEALTYLRNRLTRLRKVIGDDTAVPPYLDIDRKQIALRTGDDIVIDISQFEQSVTTVETHPHRQLAGCPTCMAQLDTAITLVRGELLAGLNFPSDTWEAWLVNQREHVQQRTLEAMTLLRDARMSLGEWTAVLDIAQRQLSLEAWLESAHRAMMQAHFHLGDRPAALAQFEQCEQVLWDELGVEPEEETRLLRQAIFDKSLSYEGVEIPDNLPLQTGPFFGREIEQTQLLQRLVDPNFRLMTLVGAGGIGKTRLSIEVGKQVKTSFPDGVWFVPLEAIKGGAEKIKIAVGEAMGLGQDGKQLTGDQVLAILRDKQMLLIFDNSEVVLDDLAFIPEWLNRAPQMAILATSHEPLNFQAELVMALHGLPIGMLEMNAAERLFVERAQMARHDFEVTAVNLPLVRQICMLVDGSPLGIGLAAAWVRRRSLVQIRDEIVQSLDFLSTRLRDVAPRHRSMRAVLETSWQLLLPEEQYVLAALSVFPTTITAEAARKVAGAALLDLDALCEKSLLQQQQESERYLMHSLVRQFAADKLAARTPDVIRGFVDYFYQFAHAHQADYAALQPEWGNLLTAVTHAHTLQSWQTVLDMVAVLDKPWFRQIRFQDMRHGLALAVAAATQLQDQPALARMLLRLGEIEIELNDYAAAESHLSDAMEKMMRLEDSWGVAQGNYLYGRIKYDQSQTDQARKQFTESKQLFEAEEDWLGVAKNLNYLALSSITQNPDYQAAQTYLEQSTSLQRNLPLSSIYVEALRHLARLKNRFGEYESAETYLKEATKITQEMNDVGEYAAVLYEQMILYKRCNQIDRALKVGYECLEYFQKLGSLRWEALAKTQLGILHQTKKQFNQALRLFQDGMQIFVEVGDSYEQAYAHYYLYKVYAELNDVEQSQAAKQQAQQLAINMKIAQLQKVLTQNLA